MIPTALAVALALLPSSDVELCRVREKPMCVSGMDLLAEKWRQEAMDLRDGKKPTEALPLFNAVVLVQPESSLARVGRAKTFAALGRYDEQADDLAWALSRNPSSPWVWQDVAEGWIARRKWAEAEKCFARALELSAPGDQRCHTLCEEGACWLGVDMAAAPKPDELKEIPTERLVRGHLALSAAVEYAKDAGPSARQNSHALRGWFHYCQGKFSEAAADYDNVLSLSTTDGGVHAIRASVAFELSDHKAALSHAELAERYGYDPTVVVQVRCKSLVALGRYAEAKAAAEAWVRHAPKDNDAALYRALTLRLLGQDDEADRATEAAAKRHARTYFQQAWVEMQALWVWYARHADADRLLTRLLDSPLPAPDRALACAYRGDLRRQLGSSEDGFDDLTAAVRHSFGCWAGARKFRAEVAFQTQRYAVALEDAVMLTRLTPDDPDAHRLLASARGAIQMAAAVAGKEPDYRPAGPVVYPDIDRDPARRLVIDTLPNR